MARSVKKLEYRYCKLFYTVEQIRKAADFYEKLFENNHIKH